MIEAVKVVATTTIFERNPQFGISKALVEIGNPPITLVEHQINKLRQAAISPIVVGTGDHANVARYVSSAYINDPTVHIAYTSVQLGNGGDLLQALRGNSELFGEQMLITNVDGLMDIDEKSIVNFHNKHSGKLTIALTRNKNVPNEGAFLVDADGKVLYSHEAAGACQSLSSALEQTSFKGSSTGVILIETKFLRTIDWKPQDGPISLYKDILGLALQENVVFGYDNGVKPFMDVGTVDAWNSLHKQADFWQPYICYGTQI